MLPCIRNKHNKMLTAQKRNVLFSATFTTVIHSKLTKRCLTVHYYNECAVRHGQAEKNLDCTSQDMSDFF